MSKVQNIASKHKGVGFSLTTTARAIKRSYHLDHRFNFTCYRVRSISISADNRYLIVTNHDNPKIRVIDLKFLKYLPWSFQGHSATVRDICSTSDSKYFYSGSWDGSVRKFDLLTGQCLDRFDGFNRIPSIHLDDKQKFLFVTSYNSDSNIFDTDQGTCLDVHSKEVVSKYPHHMPRAHGKSFDIIHYKDKVYTGADDGSVFSWGMRSGEILLRYLEKSNFSVRKIDVSDNFLCVGCSDGKLRVFNRSTGQPLFDFEIDEYMVTDVKISRDENQVFLGGSGGSVYGVNLITHQQIFHEDVHNGMIWSICLGFDDSILLTSSEDGSVAFLDKTGTLLTRYYNLVENNLLFICPEDKAFSNGFFYTDNKNLVTVYKQNLDGTSEELGHSEPLSIDYKDRLNLKNLILSKLRNHATYQQTTDNFIKLQQAQSALTDYQTVKLLKSKF